MGLAFRFRFWVQVQCVRPHERDQHALTQVYHPCHLTNSTNWIHLIMANNSSSAFASDGKIHTALLHFGNAKRLCLFCLMKLCLFCLRRLFCLMRQNKMIGFVWTDQDWIGLMIFKNFVDQDWIGFNFCGSGLDLG